MEPVLRHRLQIGPAFGAGLVAGLVLLVVPWGSPWSSLTFFTPAIMGRDVSAGLVLPLPVVWALHLGVAVVYGFIVSLFVATLRQQRAASR